MIRTKTIQTKIVVSSIERKKINREWKKNMLTLHCTVNVPLIWFVYLYVLYAFATSSASHMFGMEMPICDSLYTLDPIIRRKKNKICVIRKRIIIRKIKEQNNNNNKISNKSLVRIDAALMTHRTYCYTIEKKYFHIHFGAIC